MHIVDLRSDTVTRPTPQMREAMYRAEVGDDVYGEDPTVKVLEEMGAKMLGFEAGLFVASGTMGNLVALLTHTQKGDEVMLEAESHIYYYEVGGLSALGGVIPRTIPGKRGKLTSLQLKEHYRGDNVHFPKTTLLCLENTHNRGGGNVYTPVEIQELVLTARDLGLKTHMDGARIFNAAAACRCDVKELVRGVDSVQFCLSKGLGAPMGSLLVGSQEFIREARRFRKMVGGGFRQIGIMAAAGIVALTTMVERLEEDHILAKRLAQGLSRLDYLKVNLQEVETNIVVAQVDQGFMKAAELVSLLKEKGILLNATAADKIRLVTHKDVSAGDIDYALEIMDKLT